MKGPSDSTSSRPDDPFAAASRILGEVRNGPLAQLERRLADLRADRHKHQDAIAAIDREATYIRDQAQTAHKSTLGNPGLQRALRSRWYDPIVAALAKKVRSGGWVKVQRHGADDGQILLIAKTGWGYSVNHGHYPHVSTAYGASGGGPRIEVHGGPTLKGAELVEALRRALDIPQPQKGAIAGDEGEKGGAKPAKPRRRSTTAKRSPPPAAPKKKSNGAASHAGLLPLPVLPAEQFTSAPTGA